MKKDLSISPELWEWLLVANRYLNRMEYLLYMNLLFAWITNEYNPVSFRVSDVARHIDMDCDKFRDYLLTLQQKGWIKKSTNFGRESLLQWCRTSLIEKVSSVRKPGVVMLRPNGLHDNVDVEDFSQYENANGLASRSIAYLVGRWKAGKYPVLTTADTKQRWEVLRVIDYEDTSFPYEELFGKSREELNLWSA